ncbi:hypothetical protein DIC82_00830 [Clostridium beijerinckii]|nr:hypothetical protein DIC82_00830 [Clostridium beijerinckii]
MKWVSFLKRSNKRKYGFTLLEVIVSMAIISIISVSVYTGYIIMIKQTKSGQVKQEVALEGKKVIEALQGNSFRVPTSTTLTIDNMSFNKNGTNFVRYLNNKYNDKEENNNEVTEATAQYIESITLTPTKVRNSNDSTIDSIKLGNDNLNSAANKIYIGKSDFGEYIKYLQSGDEEEIPVVSNSDPEKDKMAIYIYLTPKNSTTEDVEVLDYKGRRLLCFTKNITENLIINFDNYKKTDGTLPIDTEIEIYIYNKTSTVANVYMEKQEALAVDLELCKGEINIYNNRLSDTNAEFGTLYDIKVQISDKNEGTLFTGYYKKNIH